MMTTLQIGRSKSDRQMIRPAISRGFTLIETLLAITIMLLMITAAGVSFRSKWKGERAKRGTQQLLVACLKARSFAYREGREWIVKWDEGNSQLQAMPMDDIKSSPTVTDDQPPSKAFNTDLDPEIKVKSESADDEPAEFHFLPNGRATYNSFLISGAGDDVWRIQTDWTGIPYMESASQSSQKKEFKHWKKFPTMKINPSTKD